MKSDSITQEQIGIKNQLTLIFNVRYSDTRL